MKLIPAFLDAVRPIGLAALAGLAFSGFALQAASTKIEYYRLVPGFVAERKTEAGIPAGSGFAAPNKWGQYTAYLLATNGKGQRTWRIEHNLPNPGRGTAQGSTIYLLEGSARALLIDTGNPAQVVEGTNDLKTVVQHLLGHQNDGRSRKRPLDFVVANTHSHGDHTGENARMSDRTIYFMDLDWPQNAPANYVPIREGGGPTRNGNGTAVGSIDLGKRMVRAVAVPPHTRGSTAYFDAENNMLFTGDALGSAWPFLQGGPLTTYVETMKHVEEVTRRFPGVAVLPAHFYQNAAFGRDGKPLDRQYVVDQLALVNEILAGEAIGEPVPFGNHNTYWAAHGTGQIVYSPATLGQPGEALPAAYHAMRIPGSFRPEWYRGADQAFNRIAGIKADLYIISEYGERNSFLLNGSQSSLLIGGAWRKPGLAPLVRRLAGQRPVDVAVLDGEIDPAVAQELAPRRIYAAAGARIPGAAVLADGQVINLGVDGTGRPMEVRAEVFRGPTLSTGLILGSDRILFAGWAFGRQGDPNGIVVRDLAAFQNSLTDWMLRTVGSYDRVFLAGNSDWFVGPMYFDMLAQALDRPRLPGAAVRVDNSNPGVTRYIAGEDRSSTAIVSMPEE